MVHRLWKILLCFAAVHFAIADDVSLPDVSVRRTCRRRKDGGDCPKVKRRFVYDDKSHSCYEFIYGGCHGNDNRFNSERECMEWCGRMDKVPPCPTPHNEVRNRDEETCGVIDVMDENGCFNGYVDCKQLERNSTVPETADPLPEDCEYVSLKRPRQDVQFVVDCSRGLSQP